MGLNRRNFLGRGIGAGLGIAALAAPMVIDRALMAALGEALAKRSAAPRWVPHQKGVKQRRAVAAQAKRNDVHRHGRRPAHRPSK